MIERKPIEVEALKHDEAKRRNIPTAEFESVMREADKSPIRLAFERRNRDFDPQLVWRCKDEQDWSDIVVAAEPFFEGFLPASSRNGGILACISRRRSCRRLSQHDGLAVVYLSTTVLPSLSRTRCSTW